MLNRDSTVFLLDVDNTLLDNDRFAEDLRARLTLAFGSDECEHYWTLYDELRIQLGYADYLATLQKFRVGLDTDPDLLEMSTFVLDYPFAERVYPGATAAIAHIGKLGLPVILSDGDIVFQPRKIQRSGLWDVVDGRVLIYLHKERMLEAMRERFPAGHYVMVDDKPSILAAMKQELGAGLTTVFVRQGHYAAESVHEAIDPLPDLAIDKIVDLRRFQLDQLIAAATPATRESA